MRLASQLSQARDELRPLRRITIPGWHNELHPYIISAFDD